MPSKLLNVRLDAARLHKAKRLRERGITLSDVVREAIDSRYDELTGQASDRGAVAIVQEILAADPDPDTVRPRTYDVHDAHAARKAIRSSLSRARRRDAR